MYPGGFNENVCSSHQTEAGAKDVSITTKIEQKSPVSRIGCVRINRRRLDLMKQTTSNQFNVGNSSTEMMTKVGQGRKLELLAVASELGGRVY